MEHHAYGARLHSRSGAARPLQELHANSRHSRMAQLNPNNNVYSHDVPTTTAPAGAHFAPTELGVNHMYDFEDPHLDLMNHGIHKNPGKSVRMSADAYQAADTPIETNTTMPVPINPQSFPHHPAYDQRNLQDSSLDGSFDDDDHYEQRCRAQTDWVMALNSETTKSVHNTKIQVAMFLLFVFGVAGTIVGSPHLEHAASIGLVCGSVITLCSCFAVMITFTTRPKWRKHPNALVFFRSLCDSCLVIILLVEELYKCGLESQCTRDLEQNGCKATAGLTQFFLWASESWFFMMAIDMMASLKSPFTNYKRNVRRYHTFVWSTALLTSVILVAGVNFSGVSEFGYCWTKSESRARKMRLQEMPGEELQMSSQGDQEGTFLTLNLKTWGLFYVWLFFFWTYAIFVIYFAWKRLRQGISETLGMRLRVLHSVTIYVIAIIIYWGITFCVYVPYLAIGNPPSWVVQLMLFMVTCKGYFDFVVWFQMNGISNVSAKNGDVKQNEDVDVDLSPQMNLALRREVLYYTTSGIIQAVNDTRRLPPGATQQELYLQPKEIESSRDSLGMEDYMMRNTKPQVALGKGTLFIDYCPHTFQTIREHFGVDAEQYTESLRRTTNERLSEGASGAFMFFSLDQQLIVKSMSNEESVFLRSIAADYASFLLTNPDSLLTRFYGCHAIRLYGNTFHFVVMANLFSKTGSSEKPVIHRRYDIKGSWINRSAKPPSKGKLVTCRHCNAEYKFGSSKVGDCRVRVGRHEPNIVLKDNDMTAKVRLDPRVAEELYDQLIKDANFLSRLGIMDYSLLLGVQNVNYVVKSETTNKEELTATQHDAAAAMGGGGDMGLNCRVNGHVVRRSDTMKADPSDPQKPRRGLPRLFTGTRRASTVVGPSLYYFGLIDILQTWNMDKKLERFAKVHLLRQDPEGISAIPPTAYCDRFKHKMADILSISLHNEYEEMVSPEADPAGLQATRRFM